MKKEKIEQNHQRFNLSVSEYENNFGKTGKCGTKLFYLIVYRNKYFSIFLLILVSLHDFKKTNRIAQSSTLGDLALINQSQHENGKLLQ